MSSLLLLSQDVQFVERLQELSRRLSARYRTVATPSAAREWLAMQSFDALIVDARYGGTTPVETLALGWRYNPMMLGIVCNPEAEISDAWTARLAGAQVISGPQSIERIESLLRTIPESIAFGQQNTYSVLVIEDLDAPRDIICAYIEALGYPQVRGVSSAKEGIQALHDEAYKYFCVVSDLQMPEMSGIDLIKTIRQDKFLSWIPVVILTSNAFLENLVACIQAGASGFLAKPPKKTALRAELEKAKRMVAMKHEPRLCSPEEASQFESALRKKGLL